MEAALLTRDQLLALDAASLADKVIGLRNDLADDAEEIAALHQERDALADALRTERAAREAAESRLAALASAVRAERAARLTYDDTSEDFDCAIGDADIGDFNAAATALIDAEEHTNALLRSTS